MWKRKHGKSFVAKHLIICFLSSESFCVWGLGVCRRTHFALFRWAITQKSPSVRPSGGGLKISRREHGVFCVISAGPFGLCVSLCGHISTWRWQRDKCPWCGFILWVSSGPRVPYIPPSAAVVYLTDRKTIIRERIAQSADADRLNHLCQVSIITQSSLLITISLCNVEWSWWMVP